MCAHSLVLSNFTEVSPTDVNLGTSFDVNASASTGKIPPPYLDSENLGAIFQQEHEAAQTEIPNLQVSCSRVFPSIGAHVLDPLVGWCSR
ncbi:unnamed protein product [Mesocestoides corti]|uniref:Uncharacterized protein n=1 Tax=Mesocestoides corti TaxID=53468 RepID=A0A3P6HKC9_MESCO|nr:unnamed protein product [Mesocestoides corti]